MRRIPGVFREFGTGVMTEAPKRLLADIRELAPNITARAAEIEAGRRVPRDLVEKLTSIGVFRMFAPQSHGGLEVDLPAGLEVIAALGGIDGSVGWTVMIEPGGVPGVLGLPLARRRQDRARRWGYGSPQPAFASPMCALRWQAAAVYESSPLQRRLRDLHIAAQHATVQQRHYVTAGKAALAQYRRQFEDPWELAAQ
jgi:hypothetical protein